MSTESKHKEKRRKKMITVTVDQILEMRPCEGYTQARIEELWNGKKALTPTEIAALDISADDRLWALVRLMDERTQRIFACDCAERTLAVYEREYPDDSRPRDTIAVARRYADGDATVEELAAAWDAAWDAARNAAWAAAWAAARNAAWDAAWDAARNAAWAAARAAAWAAARAAARNAAWDAARNAAWAAEQTWQLQHAVELLSD